ncbi:MAG: glycosyltransferase [Candidatus Sericytochromatia bacterium]|nr:glycosyltransferase [Candidatus Sericytochromatia bacterium]
MTGTLPFISIVVPAFGRPAALAALLEALADQSYPTGSFEVLVADDGTVPPLAEQLPQRHSPFSLRFLRAPNAGPATARNRGVAEARGTIIAFTDDDCLPEPGWLDGIAEAFDDPLCYAVHGPVRSAVPPIEALVHSVRLGPQDGVATANFAIKKDVLLGIGGFDETFGAPFFEDEDLIRRLREWLGEPSWSEAVVVQHPPRPIAFAGAWRAAGYLRWLPYMQRKHPEAWGGMAPGVWRRVALKSGLLGLGLSPLFGAPALGWLGLAALFAWQARRLKRGLSQAIAHQWRIPLGSQLAFLGLEWLLDFKRAWALWQGRRVETKPPAPIEQELGF